MKAEFLILVVVVAIFVLIGGSIGKNREAEIRSWTSSKGYTIVTMQATAFDNGPYFIRPKGMFAIYKVVVFTELGRKTFWFRFNLFSTDIEEYND